LLKRAPHSRWPQRKRADTLESHEVPSKWHPKSTQRRAAGGRDSSEGGADTAEGGADTAEGGADTAEGGADTAEGGADTGEGGADTAEGGADTGEGGADTDERGGNCTGVGGSIAEINWRQTAQLKCPLWLELEMSPIKQWWW
jgi:hypothetical protein